LQAQAGKAEELQLYDGLVEVWMDVGGLVLPDRLHDVLDGSVMQVKAWSSSSARAPLFLVPRAGGVGKGLSGPSMMMMVLESWESVLYSAGGEGAPSGSLEPMVNLLVAIPPKKMVCISW
jgi:hypothetical protein